MTGTSPQISVPVSPELLAALDLAAPTVQLGMHNARYSAGRRS